MNQQLKKQKIQLTINKQQNILEFKRWKSQKYNKHKKKNTENWKSPVIVDI